MYITIAVRGVLYEHIVCMSGEDGDDACVIIFCCVLELPVSLKLFTTLRLITICRVQCALNRL